MIQSINFWLFLLGVFACHWLAPARWRNAVVAAGSALYLATIAPLSVAMVGAWLFIFYKLAEGSRRRAGITPLLVAGVLLVLAAFKYIPPLVALLWPSEITSFLIPLGISFFTFKLIHYAIEVRRNSVPPHSFSAFAAYLFLFPIFSAGPIERFDHFLQNREERLTVEAIAAGGTRIVHGLVKKFVLADLILVQLLQQRTPADVLGALDRWPIYKLWGYLLLSFFAMYLDFSAYSDLAIGSSRLLGYRITENFRWPFLAPGIGEFWKRWHRTLANWCQAYVYVPMLGLTRNPLVSIYSSFLVMGLWHAPSLHYICWGLFHATGVYAQLTWTRFRRNRNYYSTLPLLLRPMAVAATLAFVSLGNVFPLTAKLRIADTFSLVGHAIGVDKILKH
jgi:alginate O-acetyltransferase complex protein AlgI